ncbi:NUDIX hydrolase [Tissierella sp. Yu-01]|jgi:8-oxo-dGTP pyrophosphatase MutT (NUDIX family)|uniref:NUDIX hydrolase n=1 Tax=Tissierella sp. Yu-01 TaxID=3035694 RepID=UPI00240D91A3|nr:NUDIX hydrolase [Tissierella sp. Yu-01]WFA09167.1 NUDIX hydrolase [Tissierella sp. Yu-01]
MVEVSSGGVVIFGNAILLLKKYNGDWVLPKGRLERGENIKSAALREVLEETGVKGEILDYIGAVHYNYKNLKENEIVCKTVHWYLMKSNSMECTPQRKEGFIDAMYVHVDKAKDLVRYADEKKIIIKGIELMNQ